MDLWGLLSRPSEANDLLLVVLKKLPPYSLFFEKRLLGFAHAFLTLALPFLCHDVQVADVELEKNLAVTVTTYLWVIF